MEMLAIRGRPVGWLPCRLHHCGWAADCHFPWRGHNPPPEDANQANKLFYRNTTASGHYEYFSPIHLCLADMLL